MIQPAHLESFSRSVLAFSCGIHFHVLVLPALRNFHGPKAHPSSTPEKIPSPGAAAALWQMFQTPSWKCPGCSRYVELPAYDSLSAEKPMKNQSLGKHWFISTIWEVSFRNCASMKVERLQLAIKDIMITPGANVVIKGVKPIIGIHKLRQDPAKNHQVVLKVGFWPHNFQW